MTYAGRVEAQYTVPSGITVASTNGAGSPKTIPIPAGSYYLSTLLSTLITALNTLSDSAGWSGSLSTAATGTGLVTINCTGGTFGLTFPATIAAALGLASFTGVSTPQTGTAGPIGVWFPDTAIALDGDPRVAPIATDLRSTQSPTGFVVGLGGGNRRFTFKNVRWKLTPATRVWTSLETTTNNSWQTFVTETQHLRGVSAIASWFRTQSPVQIYDMTGNPMGTSLSNGWSLIGVDAINPPLSLPPLTAYYDIVIPTIVSVGT